MLVIRTIQVFLKLLPSILALRKDRKKWIRQEKNTIDSNQFRRNAQKILERFISLGHWFDRLIEATAFLTLLALHKVLKFLDIADGLGFEDFIFYSPVLICEKQHSWLLVFISSRVMNNTRWDLSFLSSHKEHGVPHKHHPPLLKAILERFNHLTAIIIKYYSWQMCY